MSGTSSSPASGSGALGPDGVHLETGNDGCLLRPDDHVIDARAFEDGVREAAAAVDDEERVLRYDRALELWRGPCGGLRHPRTPSGCGGDLVTKGVRRKGPCKKFRAACRSGPVPFVVIV